MATAKTHSIGISHTVDGQTITQEVVVTADGQQSLEVAVPDEAADQLVNIAIDVGQMKALFILSDQDITLETNSATVPDDTLSLLADEPVIWWATDLHTALLTVDVTAIYLTNASGAEATVKIRVLEDTTP